MFGSLNLWMWPEKGKGDRFRQKCSFAAELVDYATGS